MQVCPAMVSDQVPGETQKEKSMVAVAFWKATSPARKKKTRCHLLFLYLFVFIIKVASWWRARRQFFEPCEPVKTSKEKKLVSDLKWSFTLKKFFSFAFCGEALSFLIRAVTSEY